MQTDHRESLLEDLVRLSRTLGDPSLDLAILAEGNASVRDGDAFWVKASGFSLHDIGAPGFLRVRTAPCLAALDGPPLDDSGVRAFLGSARAEPADERMPSVETFMHAYLLSLPGVRFVGHCHPTAMLSLLCMDGAESLAKKRLFPDEVVCCGPEAAFVDYVDPGLPLAKAIRDEVERYADVWNAPPRAIWLRNHGLITLGTTPKEVESATLMSVKVARVWLGLLGTGRQPVCLSSADIDRIHTRPDEHYRQRLLSGGTSS